MEWLILLVVVIIIAVVKGAFSANQSYTRGSNLFKDSSGNLEKDKHLDVSDHVFYDKDGITK